MGIRELAAEAKVAEEAAAKAERKRLSHLNRRAGEVAVYDVLGVRGEAIRAYVDKERLHGEGTVVMLEDDLYVAVAVTPIFEKNPYSYGEARKVGEKVGVLLCNAEGTSLTTVYDPAYSLSALGDAIAKEEAHQAKKRERLAAASA